MLTEVVIGPCRLIQGDCMDVLPTLGKVDAVVTDPPYGMNSTSADMSGGTGRWCLPTSKAAWESSSGLSWDDEAPAIVESFPDIAKACIIWGGNFFRLPVRRGWLVWNKIIRNFSSSVCELAWTSLDRPIDAFDYSHAQLAHEGKVHPTQKPLPLMQWCIGHLPENAETILDPFMGSGTTGVACIRSERQFTGIEKEQKYFDIAVERIRREWQLKCSELPFDEPKPKRQLTIQTEVDQC